MLPIGPGPAVQAIRRPGKSDLLVLQAAPEQWLRDGYRTRMSTDAVRRDLGEILSHGEPENGVGQGGPQKRPTSPPPPTGHRTRPEPRHTPSSPTTTARWCRCSSAAPDPPRPTPRNKPSLSVVARSSSRTCGHHAPGRAGWSVRASEPVADVAGHWPSWAMSVDLELHELDRCPTLLSGPATFATVAATQARV